jgi:hypothetical protein
MWIRTSVNHVRKTMAHKRGSARKGLIRSFDAAKADVLFGYVMGNGRAG